jgi:hypothetical protein
MKKILVGFAILALSTSAVFAKKHAAKPAAAAATTTASITPAMMPNGGPTAAEKAMYKKNLHDSGMKK